MKKIFLTLGVAVVFLMTMTSCGPTTEDAIAKNDEIVADQKAMLELEDDLISAITEDGDIDVIEDAYDEYVDFLEKTLKEYEDMEAFDDNDTFRKAMIALLTEFTDVAKNEYRDLIDIWSKDAEDLTEQDFDDWDNLIEDIDDKEGDANDAFLDAQKDFAAEYNFELVGD